MEKKELLAQLRNEHDDILKLLTLMSRSLMLEEVNQFKELLRKFDQKTGPHFRFDEEAVYPSLMDIYYPGYIKKLYTDHDLAIARFNQLKHLFENEKTDPMSFYEGIRIVRMMEQYITNCEILPIRNIPLNEDQIRRIEDLYRNSKKENLSLIDWSDTKRKRKQLFFN